MPELGEGDSDDFEDDWFSAIGACLAACCIGAGYFAQQWPNRTVKVVVPYGVGGVTDTMARLTADRLGKAFNQTFVIENKLGAGGAIGVDYALNSPQDGYTILFLGSTLFTVLPLAQKVNYEPLKDLVPVSITGTNGMVLVVDKNAPYSTLREFIDYARANPGKITYSSGGPATNNHLSTAYLAGKEGLDMVHVPFGGGQAALTAVLSKSVDMHFGNSSDLIEPVKSGTVKALAVTAAMAAGLGGIVTLGSNNATAKEAAAQLADAEAKRAALIGKIDLRVVDNQATLH